MCFVEKFKGDERGKLLMLSRTPVSLLVLKKEVAMATSFEDSQYYVRVPLKVADGNEFEISDRVVLCCQSKKRNLNLRHISVA